LEIPSGENALKKKLPSEGSAHPEVDLAVVSRRIVRAMPFML
jgi:hypothetical protein